MGNPCQVLVDACRCRSVEIAMRDFLASYYCALLTLDQCSDQLTVLYTLIKMFTEARYIEVPLYSSQVNFMTSSCTKSCGKNIVCSVKIMNLPEYILPTDWNKQHFGIR